MNEEYMMPIPKGSIITTTVGEYSDYGVVAVVRALQDLNPKELRDRYLAEFPEENDPYAFEEYKFQNWLNKHGYVEELNHFKWHFGAYGHADKMYVDHKPPKMESTP